MNHSRTSCRCLTLLLVSRRKLPVLYPLWAWCLSSRPWKWHRAPLAAPVQHSAMVDSDASQVWHALRGTGAGVWHRLRYRYFLFHYPIPLRIRNLNLASPVLAAFPISFQKTPPLSRFPSLRSFPVPFIHAVFIGTLLSTIRVRTALLRRNNEDGSYVSFVKTSNLHVALLCKGHVWCSPWLSQS